MLEILDIQLRRAELHTRLPFRYGIAEMTALPHVFLSLRGRFGERISEGLAADHLPPRWFTKDPCETVDNEIEQMLRVIRQAAGAAIGIKAESPFRWWRDAYNQQMKWARQNEIAPLLAHFGLSLVERALIHAATKAAGQTFHDCLLSGGLGFAPEAVHPELSGFAWRSCFDLKALNSVTARHTVGLSDPIETSDIAKGDRLDDGLPQSLADAIRTYGLRHFKLKLSGDGDQDEQRLHRVMSCLQRNCSSDFAFSLDGNECYASMEDFDDAWRRLSCGPALAGHAHRLLFIEQPVRRDRALQPVAGGVSRTTLGAPVIIDESDGSIESLPLALDLGYDGTSHKNCKGVFKGLANKCLLAFRASHPSAESRFTLSGEDLSNIGPVALLQDLAVMATLGIRSVERNGHHYFKGLSAFPAAINKAVGKAHPDLYRITPQGYASLKLADGRLAIGSLLRSAFGPAFELPLEFTELIS